MDPRENDKIDRKELNYLVLNYLKTQLVDVSHLEREFLRRRLLPVRRDFLGEEHVLDLQELDLRNSHVSSHHLPDLLDRLLSEVSKLGPSTLLGHGSNSLAIEKPDAQSVEEKTFVQRENSIREPSRLLLSSGSPNSLSLAQHLLDQALRPRGSTPTVAVEIGASYTKFNSIQGHKLPVYSVCFDRTGHRVFTGSDDCHVKVWSTVTGQLLHTLRGHSAEITDLAIDESNLLLASASNDDTVRLWDISTFKPRGILINHQTSITTVLFCPDPDEHFLLTTTMGGIARVWTVGVQNPPPPRVYDCGVQIWCAAWSPGGQRFVTGCGDGVIRLWSVNPPVLIQSLRGHRSVPVDSIKWCNSGSRIISGCQDGTSRIWDYLEEERRWTCTAVVGADVVASQTNVRARDSIKCTMAMWTRDDAYAIIAFSNAVIKVYHVASSRVVYEFKEHSKEVFVIATHPLDNRLIVSAGYDGKVCLWDVSSGRLINAFLEGNSKISDGQFSPCGQYFVLADKDGFFTLYGTGNPQQVAAAPTAQFLSTDDNNLIRDPSGYVIDEVYTLPPHMIPRGNVQLCNEHGEPYLDQPTGLPLVDSSPLDAVSIKNLKARRLLLKKAEQSSFAKDAVQVRDSVDHAISENPRQRNSRTSRAAWRTQANPNDAQLNLDDDRVILDDLVDFLPSSDSSQNSDDSESDSGLIFGESVQSPRVPSRRRRPASQRARRGADSSSGDGGDADSDDDFGIMTRSGRRRFSESRRRSSRQAARHQNDPPRPTRNRQREEDGASQLAYKIKHKLRIHLKTYRTPSDRYPSWLSALYPSSECSGSYIPQLGDTVMFFNHDAYRRYIDEFIELTDPVYGNVPKVPSSLPALTRCLVVSIQYQCEPFIHCLLELAPTDRQYSLREICLNAGLSPEALDHLAARDVELSDAYERILKFPEKIVIRYHPSDLPDFLVLASRFEQSLRFELKPDLNIRMFFAGSAGDEHNGRWHQGKIKSVEAEAEYFPWESLKVSWASEKSFEFVSPWEILHVDPVTNEPRHCQVEAINRSLAAAISQSIKEEVITLPAAARFLGPVDLQEKRKYNSIVAFPIDIGTILQRLSHNYYRSIQQLRFEVGQLAKNVREFDQRDYDLARDANVISRFINSIIDKRKEEYDVRAVTAEDLQESLFGPEETAHVSSTNQAATARGETTEMIAPIIHPFISNIVVVDSGPKSDDDSRESDSEDGSEPESESQFDVEPSEGRQSPGSDDLSLDEFNPRKNRSPRKPSRSHRDRIARRKSSRNNGRTEIIEKKQTRHEAPSTRTRADAEGSSVESARTTSENIFQEIVAKAEAEARRQRALRLGLDPSSQNESEMSEESSKVSLDIPNPDLILRFPRAMIHNLLNSTDSLGMRPSVSSGSLRVRLMVRRPESKQQASQSGEVLSGDASAFDSVEEEGFSDGGQEDSRDGQPPRKRPREPSDESEERPPKRSRPGIGPASRKHTSESEESPPSESWEGTTTRRSLRIQKSKPPSRRTTTTTARPVRATRGKTKRFQDSDDEYSD